MRTAPKAMLCSKLAIATALVVGATPAMAQGVNGSVTSSTGIAAPTTSGNTTTIDVTGQQAVVNWSANGPSGGGLTTFQNSAQTLTFQSGSNFAVLNNVAPTVSTDAITMNGAINSLVNGQVGGTVYFYSPNGVVIGDNGRINVGSLGLTTSPIASDGQGNWMTGFGTASPRVQFNTSNIGSYVRVDNLAEVNANGAGNYVALVAPHAALNGTIRTDGGAALVGARAATITFRTNNLYDIEVTTGSTDSAGVVVNGGTIARNSQAIGGDHRAYLVAVPANTAMTMLVFAGADLGFDIAGSAGVEGNAVVLSAGRSVFNGEDIGQPNAPAASITIDNAAFTSGVRARSSDKIQISSGNGPTSFSGSLAAEARNQASVQATQNSLTIAGNLSVNADDFDDEALGGNVSIGAYNGAAMTVGGNATLSAGGFGFSASGDGLNAGNGKGGNVLVQASGGGSVSIGGSLTAAADGSGGGNGYSNGLAGNGTGGLVQVLANDSESSVTVGGATLLSATGTGGSTVECSVCLVGGGNGEGGRIDVNGAIGTGMSLSFGASLGLDVDGEGGSGDAGAGTGRGGSANLSSADGTNIVVARNLAISADGSGGYNSGAGAGGSGTGGSAFIGGFGGAGGTIDIGAAVTLSAVGSGGGTAGIGAGGAGTGGSASINAPGVTIDIGTNPDLFSQVRILAAGGGGNSAGGAGGNGRGGDASLSANGGDITSNGDVTLDAIGSGGSGRNAGTGEGGTASILVSNATADLLGMVTQDASGSGGFSNDPLELGTGGSARGGRSSMFAGTNGLINLGQLNSYADAYGGSGGTGGAASAGSDASGNGAKVETAIGGAINIDFTASLSASAYGGAGYQGAGGAALGGKVAVASRGTLEIGDSLYANATGYGGSIDDDVVPGAKGTGGQVDIFADDGGTLTLLSNVFGNASGQGGSNLLLSSVGGTGQGGTVYYQASDGSRVDAAGFVSLTAQGSGGYSGGDCTSCGGAGGDGLGGDVLVQVYGGASQLNFASGLELYADGIGSGGYGGPGGDGTGGNVNLQIANAGTIGVSGNLSLSARGEGGYQSNGALAGNGSGGDAAINLLGTALSSLGVGGTTQLDTSGEGGGTGPVGGGTAGSGAGGWSRIFGTGGQATFGGNVAILSNGTGGTAFGGAGGSGVGGLTRVNSDGADYDFLGDLLLAAISTGGDGKVGGDALAFIGANPIATATTDARILARGGTVTVLGATSLDVSAAGGNAASGGAGGDASAGYVAVHARNSDLGPATITLGALAIDVGAAGGAGGAGISGGNGGAGGSATGGFAAVTASAGNGHLIIGNTSIDGAGTGGVGGDGGNGGALAGGNGGAGGAAVGAGLYIGTESGEAAALNVNQGSASFASITSMLDAVGGAGGRGASGATNGVGGAGGAARGGDASLNSRGSLVTAGNATFTGHATGGAGGRNALEALSGVGGDATAGGMAVTVLNRVNNAAMRGTLNAGTVSMIANATGGIGSTNGLGYAGGRNAFVVRNGDVTMTSFSMLNSGSSGGDPAAVVDPFAFLNATVAVTGDFTVVNPTTVSLWADNSTVSARNLSISAGNFIADTVNPAPLNLGTVSAGTINLVSGKDIIVDANLVGDGNVLLDAGGLIDVHNVTTTGGGMLGDITLLAGGTIGTLAVAAEGSVEMVAGGAISVDNVSGNDTDLSAGGAIAVGSVSGGTGYASLDAGGNLTAGTVGANGNVTLLAGGNLLTGAVTSSGGSIVANSTGNSQFTGVLAASGVIDLTTGGTINALTVGANGAVFMLAGGGINADNVSSNNVDLTAGGVIAVDDVSGGAGSVSLDAGGNLTAGTVGANGNVTLLAGGNIAAGNVSSTGSSILANATGNALVGALTARANITLAAGGALAGGAVNAGGGLIANSTGVLNLGDINAFSAAVSGLSVTLGSVRLTGLFDARSDSFFLSKDITTGETLAINVVGNITTQAITTPKGIFFDAGGNIATGALNAGEIDFAAADNIQVGNATVAESFSLEAGGTINAGNVIAGDNIEFEAAGALVAGNLSAGLINPSSNPLAEYNVGVVSATSVAIGNVAARGWVGVGSLGTVNTGSITSGDDVLILADGNIATGAITTGAQSRLLVADSDMVATGGGVDNFSRSTVFNAVDGGAGVSTTGSLTLGGPVVSRQVDVLVGGGVTTGAIAADRLLAQVGGTANINGAWTIGSSTVRSSDIAIGAGGGISGSQIALQSTNPTQTLIGDGLSGTGYALSNMEFGTLNAGRISVLGNSASSAPIDTLIGNLTLRSPGVPGGFVTLGTADPSNLSPGGTVRVVGSVLGSGFGANQQLRIVADRVEVEATTATIALSGQPGVLGGVLIFDADRVHVAEAKILDLLALDPNYAQRGQDLAKAPAVQRADGVIRSGEIYVDFSGSAAPHSLMVQNVGPAAAAAGFIANYAEVVTASGGAPVDLIVNGQLIIDGATLTGVEVRDALMEDDDPARFTANSTINGCPLTGACILLQLPPPINPTPDIQTQFSLINLPGIGDLLFGNEELIEDNEEDGGEDSASSPIQPPAPLFNTKPLEVAGETDEPVSGGGNPALIGNGDDDDEDEDEDEDEGEKK